MMGPETPADVSRHDHEISLLREKVNGLVAEVHHTEREVATLTERLPPGLGQWMGRTETSLAALNATVGDILEALKRGYVTTNEFDAAKKEHGGFATKEEVAPMKVAFYRAFGIVLAAIITGVLALLFGDKLLK